MNYLTEDQLIEKVFEYIDDARQKQAILIDGEWGTGKTYFIKNILLEDMKQKYPQQQIVKKLFRKKINTSKNIIYISLYGIETCKEISDELCMNILANKIKASNPEFIKKGINITSKFATSVMKVFNTENNFKASDFMEIENSVIIFDDLERCSISINDVLGYINNLVEHNNIKVILVANELEIGKLNLYKNIEQKYAIALSKNLKLENSTNNEEPINKEMLIRYTNELFFNDPLYNKIKEKLIGTTIKYRPNIANLFDILIDEYILDDKTKDLLKNNKEKILYILNERSCYNLRTLTFALMSFEKFNKIILNKKLEQKYYNEIIVSILKYCVELAIFIKNGYKPPEWKDGTEMGTINLYNKSVGESLYGYKFVDTYLINNIIDNEAIENVINRKIYNMKERDELEKKQNMSLNKLNEWYKLEDEEFEMYLNQLLEELKENQYKPIPYKGIAILIANLKVCKFNYKIIDDIEKQLIKDAEFINDYIQIDSFDVYGDSEFLQNYNKIISPIKEKLKILKKEFDGNEINEIISSGDNWTEQFYNYCNRNRDKFIINKKFFSLIDLDNLSMVIENSNTRDIYNFRDIISFIYNSSNINEFLYNDIEYVKKFNEQIKSSIESISKEKQIRKLALKQLNEDINKIIQKLKV